MTVHKLLPNAVLMVRPAAFGFNPETAASNAFQQKNELPEAATAALAEFDAFRHALEAAGVQTFILDDNPEPPKPDAVFPNNWFSHHPDGSLVFYPMKAENRRRERRPDLSSILNAAGFKTDRLIDLSGFEQQQLYLEGTGSLVLDYTHKIAYAAQSSRTHSLVLQTFCKEMGYHPFLFQATDTSGLPIYHTNVVMALGSNLCIVCLEAFRNLGEQKACLKNLQTSGRQIIAISHQQMAHFAGNALQLYNKKGEHVLVISETAWQALRENQRKNLHQLNDRIVRGKITTIEQLGGGSVRCMLAGLWRQNSGC